MACENKDEFTAKRKDHTVRSSAIRNEGRVLTPVFFSEDLRGTAEIHQEDLRDVVKPWMTKSLTDGPKSSSRTPPPHTRPRRPRQSC